jgi:hypothetical protein
MVVPIAATTAAAVGGSTAGSFLSSIGGSLASNILGGAFGGKKKRGPSPEDMIGYNSMERWQAYDDNVNLAKKHGFHPLAALGLQPSGGRVVGSSTGSIEGQNLGRALASGIEGYREKQLGALAVERAKLENDLLRTQITNVNRQVGDAPNPVGDDKILEQPHKVVSKKGSDHGLAAGKPPAFVTYDLGNGQSIELPFSEEGPSEALENLPFPIKQLKAAELYGKRYKNKHDKWVNKKVPSHVKGKVPKALYKYSPVHRWAMNYMKRR